MMGMPALQETVSLLIVLWTLWPGLTHNPCVLGTPGDPITCTISGATGDPSANITCLFGKDLRQPKSAFSVVHYGFDAANDVPGTDVAVCISSHSSDRPECAVRDGYRMHFDLTENATITIIRVSTGTEGRYACHLVPLEDRTTHLCEVNATEFLRNFSKVLIQDYTEAPATETQHKNHTENVAEEPTSSLGVWVAGSVLCLAVVVAALVIFLVHRRRNSQELNIVDISLSENRIKSTYRRKLAKSMEGERNFECAPSHSPVNQAAQSLLLAQPEGHHHTLPFLLQPKGDSPVLSPLLSQPKEDNHVLSHLPSQLKGDNHALLSQRGGDNCGATIRCQAQSPVLQSTADDCTKAPRKWEYEHLGLTFNPSASAAAGNTPEASTNASDDQKTMVGGVQPQKSWNHTHALSSSAQDDQTTLHSCNNTNALLSSAEDDPKTFELQVQPQKGIKDANIEESSKTIQLLKERVKSSYIGNKNINN